MLRQQRVAEEMAPSSLKGRQTEWGLVLDGEGGGRSVAVPDTQASGSTQQQLHSITALNLLPKLQTKKESVKKKNTPYFRKKNPL